MALKERTKRRGYWFKKLSRAKKIILITFLVILVLVGVAATYVYAKLSKLNTEELGKAEIIVNEHVIEEEIGVGYTNFVLFGADSRDNDVEANLNTDTIIIVSLNNATKEIRLVSVFRDTLMDVKNGSIQKCNSAYRIGGAKQAINMLNTNLDMNIEKYVTVNFSIVSDVVDMLGGIEVTLTQKEVDAMNDYIWETAMVAGKEGKRIEKPGRQTLDGVQATTYARIRKGVGDDNARTGRQRELINLVLKKAVKADLATINKIIDTVFPQISTNLTMGEVLKYAKSLTKYNIGESSAFPFNKLSKTLAKRGSCAYSADFSKDVTILHEFIYGEEEVDYEPSDTVHKIEKKIKSVVGSDVKTTQEPATTTEAQPTVPEQAQPQQPVPEQTQPQQPVPEQTQPQQPAPEQTQPQQPAPEQTQPQQPAPEQVQPQQPAPVAEEQPAA